MGRILVSLVVVPYFPWPRRRHRPGFVAPLVSGRVDGGVATPSSMPSCGRCVDASTDRGESI